jgi:radical SAM protein with 4Fe4S-binding SPASM domain
MFIGVEIEINHHCNLACDYCPNSKISRVEQGTMTLENFTIIAKQLEDINYKGRISYHFYNEPLLHPELEIFIQTTKQYLPETKSEIFTNGTLLTSDKYNKLRVAGVDKFTVTKHRGLNKITFDDTYASLSEIEKNHVKYYDHTKLIYTSRGGLVEAGRALNENILKRKCLIPECTIVITVNGNVVPCYEDYEQKNVMGNIHEQHIKDIWGSPGYVQFRKDLWEGHRNKYEACKNCNNIQVIQ